MPKRLTIKRNELQRAIHNLMHENQALKQDIDHLEILLDEMGQTVLNKDLIIERQRELIDELSLKGE